MSGRENHIVVGIACVLGLPQHTAQQTLDSGRKNAESTYFRFSFLCFGADWSIAGTRVSFSLSRSAFWASSEIHPF